MGIGTAASVRAQSLVPLLNCADKIGGVKVKVLYPLGSGDKIRFVLAPILKTVSPVVPL